MVSCGQVRDTEQSHALNVAVAHGRTGAGDLAQ
jgi:hypothetical protein